MELEKEKGAKQSALVEFRAVPEKIRTSHVHSLMVITYIMQASKKPNSGTFRGSLKRSETRLSIFAADRIKYLFKRLKRRSNTLYATISYCLAWY